LHGILHRYEGDYANVKAWARDTPTELLKLAYDGPDPHRAAYALIDRVARLCGKSVDECLATSKDVGIEAEPPPADPASLNEAEVRGECWHELRVCFEELERAHGWAAVDGTIAYTKDEKGGMAEKKSGMLLGEGYRTF